MPWSLTLTRDPESRALHWSALSLDLVQLAGAGGDLVSGRVSLPSARTDRQSLPLAAICDVLKAGQEHSAQGS